MTEPVSNTTQRVRVLHDHYPNGAPGILILLNGIEHVIPIDDAGALQSEITRATFEASEIQTLRRSNFDLRALLQEILDDMTFNVAPSKGTMARIAEALRDG